MQKGLRMPSRRDLLQTLIALGPMAVMATPAMRSVASTLAASPIPPGAAASDEDFWTTVQQAFAVDRTIVNLNNGGVSPSPRTVQDTLRRLTEQANQMPAYELWRRQEPQVETVREGLASMFGVDTEEIAITRNASESLETLQLGLPLRSGDEVVTTTQDYPRMLTTWDQRARRDGIVVRKVRFDVPVRDVRTIVAAIEAALTPKTKVIHVSHVVFLTGQIMPVREICRLARERGIWCIVDGAHSFAHFPFRQQDLECDFFGTSLHKWLTGPIGTGMLYVKKERIPDVWPLMAAPKESDGNIRKFEEIGTHSAAVHNALGEALAFNRALGLERKATRFRYLHRLWTDRLKRHEAARFLTDIDDDRNQCGLRLVHIEGTDPVKLSGWLLDKRRIFTVAIVHDEFKGLRVAPNVYTTPDEIERFADAMEEVVQGKVSEVKA